MARPWPLAMVLAILAGCGGAPPAAIEPAAADPSCERATGQWVHTRFSLVMEASGEVRPGARASRGGGAEVSELVALVRLRRDVVSVRVEAQPMCTETSVSAMQSAAQSIARRLVEEGVPASMLEVIGSPADGFWPRCRCAPSSAKGRPKWSVRCDRIERTDAVRVGFSVRVVECE